MLKANYITTSEFQTMNPDIDFSNIPAATISGMISRGSRLVDNYLNYSLALETIAGEKSQAVINSDGDLVLFPQKLPIQSLQSAVIKKGSYSMNLILNDGAGNPVYDIVGQRIIFPFQQMQTTGTFSIRNFYQLRERLFWTLISYTAGYDTIPDDLKDACNLMTKDIWARQANPIGIKKMTQGAISMEYSQKDGDSDMVTDAKSILDNYARRNPIGY